MDRVHVSIDQLECACIGYCVELVPAVFELSGEGPTMVVDPHPPIEALDRLREAESLCPTRAITVELLART
jgi:ferredoxin